MKQSTNHILMVEPAEFYANPQTQATNAYQVRQEEETHEQILAKALAEFRTYRDMLVSHGVTVTTVMGRIGSPDMVFPNWASTYDKGRLIIYPMLSENRRAERTPEIMQMLRNYYPHVTDWSGEEDHGLALESTASIVADHVNKRGYSGLSARTSPELVERWAAHMGYDVISFDTRSHTGIPVYHTDYLMYIGTFLAAICAECITDDKIRDRVLGRLRETHDVIELSAAQMKRSCGNALEVVGKNGELMLTMSQDALGALTEEQKSIIAKHYKTLICPDLRTLEKYGGGSARCMIMEMF